MPPFLDRGRRDLETSDDFQLSPLTARGVASIKKELEELAKKVPKRKSPDKMTDEEFDTLEDYEDKILEIELAEEFLAEMKRR